MVFLSFVKVGMGGLWSVFPFRGIGDWVVVSISLSLFLSRSPSRGGWLVASVSLSLSLYISLYLVTVREDRQASDQDIFVGAF